jgi:NADH-quinone oxidoreductase subunit G
VLYLRLRHAVIEDGATLIELTPRASGLSRYAAHRLHYHPGEVAALAASLASDSAATKAAAGVEPAVIDAASAALRSGVPVTVIVGRASLAESAATIVDAALALRDALPGARFLSALRRGNVHGALDMGLAPGLLPGRTTLAAGRDALAAHWSVVPASAGLDTAGILDAAAEGRIDTLVLLGADPLLDFPDRALAKRALARAQHVISVDLFVNDSGRHADVVLAAAGATEVDGSFTNLEGRVSAVHQKVTPPGTARADWMIAAELAYRLGADLGLESTAQIRAEIAAVSPLHAGLIDGSVEDRDGFLVRGGAVTAAADPTPAPAADAYSLRLVATRAMYDLGTFLRHSESSAHLAAGTAVRLNPADFAGLGVTTGAEVVVSSPRGSLQVPVHADAGVPRGSAAMVVNQPNADVLSLIDCGNAVTDVRVERA